MCEGVDCVQARFLGIGQRNAPRGVLRPMGALGMVLVLLVRIRMLCCSYGCGTSAA